MFGMSEGMAPVAFTVITPKEIRNIITRDSVAGIELAKIPPAADSNYLGSYTTQFRSHALTLCSGRYNL